MNRLNIPCLFSDIDKNEDSRLLNCRIKVQHDKSNLNGSYFDKEDMIKCAEKSLRRTPILGSVIYDEESEEYRLNGHDMKYEIIKTEEGYDLKICHIERIYGYIPEDADISTEYDEDSNKTYLVTNGVLWKNYLDEVEDILNNNDGNTEVSMEVSVNESFDNDDGLLQIKDYTFEGITMLGVPPGMKGANLQLFSNDTKNIKQELEELINVYSLEKEGNDLDENKNTEHDNENFGLSVQNISDQISSQIASRLIEREDYWGDKYQSREFYFMDILPDDKVAIVENADWERREYFGIPYVINEDVISLDFENKKSYIQEWREMNGDAEPKIYSIDDTQFKEYIMNKFKKKDEEDDKEEDEDFKCGDSDDKKKKKKYEELETEFTTLEESYSSLENSFNELKEKYDAMSDYQELKDFKDNYDKAKYEKEVSEITAEFDFLEEEEIKEFKEKVLNKEITKEQYKKELFCLLGMKKVENKKEFSKKETSSEINILDENETVKYEPYGGLFKKYLNK